MYTNPQSIQQRKSRCRLPSVTGFHVFHESQVSSFRTFSFLSLFVQTHSSTESQTHGFRRQCQVTFPLGTWLYTWLIDTFPLHDGSAANALVQHLSTRVS